MDIPSGSHRRGNELTDDALIDAFSRWQDELLGTLYFLIENSDAAHDALQRAFVKCWRRRAYLAESPNLRAAIFRIALNTGRDYQTELGKKTGRETSKPPSEEEKAELGEVELLRRGILSLRLEERRIFLLRQNGHLKYDEIGKTVNMPVETVKTRMRLALRKLSRIIWVEERSESQSYLELLYDILSDDEAARCRIQAETGDAAPQAEALRNQITEAARRTRPKITFPNPADFASPSRPILRRRAARRRLATRRRKLANPRARLLNWVAVLCMVILLIVSVGGYLYHREQLAGIAEEHMRLIVTGPGEIRDGGLNQYTVSTTSVTGRPIPVQVNLSVYDSGGERIYEHNEKTDLHGRLLVTLPEDLELPENAWIETWAVHQEQVRRAKTRPSLGTPANTVAFSADRRVVAPGDTVGLRAVVLNSLRLTPAAASEVRFSLENPQGKLVAAAEKKGNLNAGTATGAVRIPEDAAVGTYYAVVESLDSSFPKKTLQLRVRKSLESKPAETEPAKSPPSGAAEKPKHPPGEKPSDKSAMAAESGKIDIRFFPEGGDLVANLENRVYFEASRDGLPSDISGRIVDDEEHFVAAVETTRDGRGVFAFVPRPDRNYRFFLDRPGEETFERLLPPMNTKKDVVIDTGAGVFDSDQPLEFNVRSAKSGLPLVASAFLRNVQIGETAFSTRIGPNGQTANPVVVEVPPTAAGTIRLTIWDYSTAPPRPLAERLVYRRPSRNLRIVRTSKETAVVSGAPVQWDLYTVAEETEQTSTEEEDSPTTGTDRNGTSPQPATLAAVAVPAAAFIAPGLKESVFLGDSLAGGLPPKTPSSILDGSPDSNTALDLLLATRGWRYFTDAPPKGAECEPVETWPSLADNLAELQTRYLDCLAAYQAGRTRVLNTLTTLSAFGGLAFIFLLAMTAMLGIPTGIKLWLPGLGTACVCLAVGSILMHPDRLNESPDGQSAFATDYGTRRQESATNTGPQSIHKRQYRCFEASHVDFIPSSAKLSVPPVLWNPSIEVPKSGTASLSWTAPNQAGVYHVRVDGYAVGDEGMFGSTEWTFSVTPSKDQSKAAAASKSP